MHPLQNIRLAFKAIRSNMVRSLITLTIIAIGIAALVGILTALDVLLFSLSDSFSDIGANSFTIERKNESLKGNRGGRNAKYSEPITYDQAIAFKERYDYPAKVGLSLFVTSLATVKYGKEKSNPNVSITGADDSYVDIRGYELSAGRIFNASELEDAMHRAVIGKDICKLLFDGKPNKAVGQTIHTGKAKYKIIGVLDSKGSSFSANEDRVILIPLKNAYRYYNTKQSNYGINVNVSDAISMETAESEAIGTFRNIRKLKAGKENDFEIEKSSGIMDILKENTVTIRWATIFIGFATLLGAAIGLMNIMLVSVTERTREIGVCKALGASSGNIRFQFLTEAVVISLIGGVVGVILGLAVGLAVATAMGGAFIMPWNWIALGVTLCFLVGVMSGWYPAARASSLDPIEALRYE